MSTHDGYISLLATVRSPQVRPSYSERRTVFYPDPPQIAASIKLMKE